MMTSYMISTIVLLLPIQLIDSFLQRTPNSIIDHHQIQPHHHLQSVSSNSYLQKQQHRKKYYHNHFNRLSSTNDEFIDYILSPPSNDPSFRCTHMIGIPLEQNHDLLLELESIQRAILYHCPLLINACVAPVVTRMPLLLVDTKGSKATSISDKDDDGRGRIDVNEVLFNRSNDRWLDDTSSNGGENELLTSRDPITRTLHDIVNTVVEEMVNVHTTIQSSSSTSTAVSKNEGDDDENNDEDSNNEREGLNSDNVKPLLMKFQGLEIDGDMNNILHAIGSENEGTELLRDVLNEITKRIEKRGWSVYVPEDNPQGKIGGLNEDGVTWRPRIPFMRLPSDFYETLPDPKGFDGQWQNYSDEQKNIYMRTPEEGGNGISPLFWFKWWDDKLCKGKSIRIRELAVYGRTGPIGMTEQAFYIPHLRTRLPDGNTALQDDERKDREYDNERRLEQEVMIDDYEVNDDSSSETKFEKDMATYKSNADRRILQTIFDASPSEIDSSVFDFDEEGDEEDVTRATFNLIDESNESSPRILDDSDLRKAEIIQSIAKPIATGDWSSLQRKKEKPDPKDNPILRNWKQKMAENPTILQSDAKDMNRSRQLPPFPSDEHFVGIWQLEIIPKGSIFDEATNPFGNDQFSNENIVLRVDGTTAGGPILDVENQHRAAGGTWKFFQALWIGPSDEETEVPVVKTRLRIRLLIPPLKEKVLVMEGEVINGALVSPESISRDNLKEMRKSVFDSFVGNAREQNSVNPSIGGKSFLQCSGEVWCEDATKADGSGEKKRLKVGRFHLGKRKEEGNNYKYSIPAPQRYQD